MTPNLTHPQVRTRPFSILTHPFSTAGIIPQPGMFLPEITNSGAETGPLYELKTQHSLV